MELNIPDKLKIKILRQLKDEKVYSFYSLAKAVGANNTTVMRNANFLHVIGLVRIDKLSKEESASGKPSYRVKITEDGLRVLSIRK